MPDSGPDAGPDAGLDAGGGSQATGGAARPRQVSLTAHFASPDDGGPAPGTLVWVTVEVEVEPLNRGSSFGGDPQPYPPSPLLDSNGNPFPAPVPLFSLAAGDAQPFPAGLLLGGSSLTRRTQVATDGSFALTMPTPGAVAYAAGARTDADMDPLRWGRWSVQYFLMMEGGEPYPFAVDEAAMTGGVLDISDALSVGEQPVGLLPMPASPGGGGGIVLDTGTAPPAPSLLALLTAMQAQTAALQAQIAALAVLDASPAHIDGGNL